MKRFLKVTLFTFFLMTSSLFAKPIVLNIGVPKAPPALPVVRMMETNAMGDDCKLNLKFWNTPEILIGMVQGKGAEIYAFPLTVVSKLYNKGMDVKLLNVNTWGVAYFLTSDETVKTWKDLKGKTIYKTLKSSPPDIFTRYFLDKAGLKEKEDYKVVYATKMELANLLIQGKVENATLIEPLVTMVMMKNPKVKRVISFEKEWQKIKNDDSHIPAAGMGVLGKFSEENPELVKKFNVEYEKALNWIVENPKEAGKLAAKIGMKPKVIEKAIPNMGLKFVAAKDVKEILDEYYNMLKNYDPKTVGGKVPNENFYFKK